MASQPNILMLMADQLTGTLFADGPAPWLHTPNLRKLAERSVRFARCYAPSPLCAPGRAAFMSGQMPSRTRVYDNAAEFTSDIPTYAHHLRRAGYSTCLSGKMHFVGPDQLHGFEERLTTDIYPADFGWTPDYRKPGERIDWWYHNMGSVTGAGVAETSNQLEYDDEVAFQAQQKLYDYAREIDGPPWCLTVSFTHPHDPFVARRRYWDLYENCEHLQPEVSAYAFEDHDPHSKRIFEANDWLSYDITEENIARSRRAYFANISYLDDKFGEILQVLEDTRQADNTIIMVCADHGEMLGERGLWFKMSMFDGSSRVPLMIAAPGLEAATIETPVSNVDVLPTLCDLAGVSMAEIEPWTDGQSLLPVASGGERTGPVRIEYAAEASIAPIVCLVDWPHKYIHCPVDPPLLFDLAADPHELTNLAGDPAYAQTAAAFAARISSDWDLDRFDAEIRASQARRHVVYDALRNGAYYPWDYQPLRRASERYMRNHLDLNDLEESKRFPRGD